MKRIMSILGLMAAFAVTGCNKVSPVGEPSGLFTIRMTSDETRTTNDGMHTLWAKDDAVSLLYAPAGTSPKSEFTNVKMTLTSGEGTSSAEFTGQASLSGANDFYAVYPHTSALRIPGERTSGYIYIGNRNGVTQYGYDDMGHISGSNCPLYGVVLNNDSGTIPQFSMKQLASLMELDITSSCTQDFVLTKVTVEASEDIVGSYYIDITGEAPAYTPSGSNYVSNKAIVSINEGTAVKNGSTVKVYIPVKPYTQAAGTPLHITLNATVKGNAQSAAIDITGGADAAKRTFSPGLIKKINVSVSEFSGASAGTVSNLAIGTEATVTGQVAAIANSGFVLADATGAVFVFKQVSDLTIGQTVTVSGTPTEYSKGIQFPSSCTVTKGASGSFTYPEATALDASSISSFVGKTEAALAQYVTFTGDVSGTRDFIVGGATEANVTGYSLPDEYTEILNTSSNVTVKGYACFILSGKCSVIVTDIVQNSLKPVLPDSIDFPQGGDYSGTTNYPFRDFKIENLDNTWKVTVTYDGTVFTYGIWFNNGLYYSISTNPGAARTGWLQITLTKGGSVIEKKYIYHQAANPRSTEKTYTWTMEKSQITKAAGEVTVSDVAWSFTDATYIGFDTSDMERGVQVGSSGNPQKTGWTLSTTGISGTIKSVRVNACTGGEATISISVDGKTYLPSTSLIGNVEEYSGNGTSSGEIAITMNATSKAMYIKSVEIVYE